MIDPLACSSLLCTKFPLRANRACGMPCDSWLRACCDDRRHDMVALMTVNVPKPCERCTYSAHAASMHRKLSVELLNAACRNAGCVTQARKQINDSRHCCCRVKACNKLQASKHGSCGEKMQLLRPGEREIAVTGRSSMQQQPLHNLWLHNTQLSRARSAGVWSP